MDDLGYDVPFFESMMAGDCGKHGVSSVSILNVRRDLGFVSSSDLQNRIEDKNHVYQRFLSFSHNIQTSNPVKTPLFSEAKCAVMQNG